jgi:hypothetical protein
MGMRWLIVFACCVGVAALSGCHEKDNEPSNKVVVNAVEEKAEHRSDTKSATPFHDRLLEIAASYPEYGRADGMLRWAPWMCDAPPPPTLRLSASTDARTHGRKLYFVFAKINTGGCYFADGKANPVGQVVVKESWVPEEIPDKGQVLNPIFGSLTVRGKDGITKTIDPSDPYVPYARKDGRLYHATKKADLFIMFKTDPSTPATDEGWVYGTVTADGKTVTSAGRVESCVNCHCKAPHDRLFGLP